MNKVALVAGVLLLALGGCTSYQPKPGEATARLRFVTFTPNVSSLTVLDPTACPERKSLLYRQMSWVIPHSPTIVGVPGKAAENHSFFEETYIRAGRALVTVGSSQAASQYVPGYTCYIGVAFDARADANYEVEYRYDGRRCTASVREVVADGASARRIAVPGVRQVTAAGVNANLCSAL